MALHSEQELLKNIKGKTTKLNEILIQSKELIKYYKNTAYSNINRETEENDNRYNKEKDELEKWYEKSVQDIRSQIYNTKESFGYTLMPFEDARWNSFLASQEENTMILLGSKVISNGTDELEIPFAINFMDSNNLLFMETGEELIKSIVLRYFSMIPAGELQLLIIDPEKMGQGLLNFLKFKEYNSKLINDKVYVDKYEIDKKISDIWNIIQDRAQNYLGIKQCNDIYEYNKRFQNEKLDYKIMVLLSFSKQISKESLEKLMSLLNHGPRCGIYVFISVNNQLDLPQEFKSNNINHIIKTIVKVPKTKFEFEFNKTKFKADSVDNEITNFIIDSIGQSYVEKENEKLLEMQKLEEERIEREKQEALERDERENKGILFEELEAEYLQEESWWKDESNNKLEAPIGKNADGQLQSITFADSFVHALIAGIPGSGKSELLHTIILSLSLKYSPEQLKLYLLDFKEGLEFNAYKNLPHAKLVSIKSDKEFGIGILEELNEKLRERANILKEKGSVKINGEFPRILVVIDEFQELFRDNDNAQELLRKIVVQGRSAGIHLIMASQGMSQSGLSSNLKNKFGVRLALRCNRDDLDSIISCSNDEVEYVNKKINNKIVYGNIIYNNGAGERKDNNKVKMAYMDDDKKSEYINKLIHKAEENGYKNKTKVFDGNSLPELDIEIINNIKEHGAALIGETVKGKEPIPIIFYDEKARNLIISGKPEHNYMVPEMLLNILGTVSMITKPTKLFYGDYSKDKILLTLIDDYKECFNKIQQFDNYIDWDLEGIAKEIKARKDGESSSDEKIFILLSGYERIPSFSNEEFEKIYNFQRADNEENIVKNFMYILQEGPYVDIYTIMQTSRLYDVNRKVLNEFGVKVAFPMDEEDMSKINIPTKIKNRDNSRAIFYDKQNDIYEKFMPYKKPSEEILRFIKENKYK